ncbi:MAG: PEGA domain-containing protein [Candidatus Omnitrophica bacterium]|nr:PEGA domain-containing protein [Candidatus Omnitrophota bacterium]MBI3010741.1 PEGA domain-containing protein [Candidatus Omnitrophota bacterium]
MTGCVYRSLTIRTEPPGAMVYVNDQLKGESPVKYDFLWYGWHRVMVRKEGFERVEDRKLLRSPAYLWIPLDLIMELVPFPIRDNRSWSYTLTPVAPVTMPTPPVLEKESNDPQEATP